MESKSENIVFLLDLLHLSYLTGTFTLSTSSEYWWRLLGLKAYFSSYLLMQRDLYLFTADCKVIGAH